MTRMRGRNSLSLSTLTLVMILALLIQPGGASALALCATTVPQSALVVENDEILALACDLGWIPGGPAPNPCPRPDPPVIYDLTAYPGTAQSHVLKVFVPYNMNISYVTAVWWRMWKGPDLVWEHRQVDFDTATPVPGDWVKFGAPGLDVQSGHRFQVAIEDHNNRQSCWSDYSTLMVTGDYGSSEPVLPTNMGYVAEDLFERPVTDFGVDTDEDEDTKRDGDGMGPADVWLDMGQEYTKIEDCDGDPDEKGDCARVMQATLQKYVRHQATHEHSYAELLFTFAPEDTDDTLFNFEMESRFHEVGGVKKFYLAKLFNDNPDITGCNLVVGRWDLQPSDYTANLEAHRLSIPDSNQPKCNEEPFSGGQPVWFRIETDDNESDNPVITATLAWNCSAGNAIHQCANVCTKTWTDTDDAKKLAGIGGHWLFSVHHGDYYIDTFRAASEIQPTP